MLNRKVRFIVTASVILALNSGVAAHAKKERPVTSHPFQSTINIVGGTQRSFRDLPSDVEQPQRQYPQYIADYRYLKSAVPEDTWNLIKAEFARECELIGSIPPKTEADRQAYEGLVGWSSSTESRYLACFDRTAQPIGVVIMRFSGGRYSPKPLAVFIMNSFGAQTTYREQSRLIAEDEALHARIEKHDADMAATVKRWRPTIQIGTDTNCGTVIQVRGPMIEVSLQPIWAHELGVSQAWFKREALLPAGTRNSGGLIVRCETIFR